MTEKQTITIHFIQNGEKTSVEVTPHEDISLLEVAHEHDINLEGACGGSLACSTCHVVVDPSWYGKLEEATEDENDMLDLAFGLTPTSRLACQIPMTWQMDGLCVTVPSETRHTRSLGSKTLG